MRSFTVRKRMLAPLLIALWVHGAAWGILREYEFIPDQSVMIQTGGFMGGYWEFEVSGRFVLQIDRAVPTAAFVDVSATYGGTGDLGALFEMEDLEFVDMNDTGIVFELPAASHGVPIPRSAIHLTVIFDGTTAYLSGGFYEAVADGFMYQLYGTGQEVVRTLYVSPDGDDTHDGWTPETALQHIQTGIRRVPIGGTVVVLPGTYAEDLNFGGKNLVVISENVDGFESARNTIIDGDVCFQGSEDSNCVLAGFTIKGSIAGYDWETDPTGTNHATGVISHCLIKNVVTGCGGLILGFDGLIENCVVSDSYYMCLRPSPVWTIVECSAEFRNCTLWNLSDGLGVGPGETVRMDNCIVNCGIGVSDGGTLEICYSDVVGTRDAVSNDGEIMWGPGNIDVDPCFATEGGPSTIGDYHLKSPAGRYDPTTRAWDDHLNLLTHWLIDTTASPCIDAGNPLAAIGSEPFPNGGLANMGAYGNTAEASKSYFGTPPCRTVIAGDINGDCKADFIDFTLFSLHWLEQPTP